MLINKLYGVTQQISNFLCYHFEKQDNVDYRSFYGETFSIAFLQREGKLNEKLFSKLLDSYIMLDKNDSEFHWEFNNYAMVDYLDIIDRSEVKNQLFPLRFKETPCTNWTLLRSNVRIRLGIDVELALKEAKLKINQFQKKSGLILDDPGVKSFQYHCFSMAMIAEIYEKTNDSYFLDAFLKGVSFIRNFILNTGETLYIGRGQNQSFGYGALIYILSLAYKHSMDKSLLAEIECILNFLIQHQRKDGSFPLVMNSVEKNIPQIVDMMNPEYSGWYPYNNYFDYLPFMAFFISKAKSILVQLDLRQEDLNQHMISNYRDKDFIKVVTSSYEAVISRPGGYWTNDLPIPFVVANGKRITPCYGGEQFQKSLYRTTGIALPFCRRLNLSIRWRAISFFHKNTLWLFSPLGIMKRKFIFHAHEIEIKSTLISPFQWEHLYLFDCENKKHCTEIDHFDFLGLEYSATGPIECYRDKKRKSIIHLRINT